MGTSPIVRKEATEQINFYDAVKAITVGQKVTKLEWGNPEEYCFMQAEILHIHKGGEDHKWIISLADIEGNDYTIL